MRLLYLCLIFGGVFLYLQNTQSFYFYYIEQLQLFLFTKQYAIDTFSQIGGGSVYLARFWGQFFVYPTAGALITSLLFTACVGITQQILKFVMSRISYVLSTLPAIALLVVQLDKSYLPEGTWSYLLMLFVFWGYLQIGDYRVRMLCGLGFQVVLYWVAGPIAFLFTCIVFLYELLMNWRTGLLFLIMPFCQLGIGFWSVYAERIGEWRFAFLPDGYYDPLAHSSEVYYAWYMFPVCLILARILKDKEILGKKRRDIWLLFSLKFFVVIGLIWFPLRGKANRLVFEQDYYLRTEAWDKIISNYPLTNTNLQQLNILNLALAKQGRLTEDFLKYPQQEEKGLLTSWDNTMENAITLSDIYYHIGDIASAQKFAFEGLLSSHSGGNPRLLQRLIQTNLIGGAYAVAEKYIQILEHTLYYKKWALQYRSLLSYEAIQRDAVLGSKQKALIKEDRYIGFPYLLQILEQLAINNPDNSLPIQYLTVSYMLSRNLHGFQRLLNLYYHTPVWPSLSIREQEAVVALYQQQPDKWLDNGVSFKVESSFHKFDTDMKRFHNQMNVKEIMGKNYGGTYWYYLLFNKE